MERFLDTLKTPGWQRTVLLRRVLAGLLVILAGLTALDHARPSGTAVVVLTRSIAPGVCLQEDALTIKNVSEELVPDSALTSLSEATGLMVTTTLEPGEILTSHKLVAPSHHKPGTDLVPLNLANPDIIPVLRHGDIVSVISADTQEATANPADPPQTGRGEAQEGHSPEVLATDATVVVAAAKTENSPETLLVELPHDVAARVAAVGLNTQLTVVISGGRG